MEPSTNYGYYFLLCFVQKTIFFLVMAGPARIYVLNRHHLAQGTEFQVPNGVHRYWITRDRNGYPGCALQNPFRLSDSHVAQNRDLVVLVFKTYLHHWLNNPDFSLVKTQFNTMLESLQCGYTVQLVCCCKPLKCHGDVIRETLQTYFDDWAYSITAHVDVENEMKHLK